MARFRGRAVMATRMAAPFTIVSADGIRVGGRGDWLVSDAETGAQRIYTDADFRAAFEPADARATAEWDEELTR